MSRVLIFAGSMRKNSLNLQLARILAERLAGRCEVDFIEPADLSLPLYDQDDETDALIVGEVLKLYMRFSQADGYIVVAPEYNGSVSPLLKNTIDWVSRIFFESDRFSNPFQRRPLLLGSVSTGWSGGAFGLAHARAIFTYLGALIPAEQICLPYAERFLQEEEFNLPPALTATIDQTLTQFLELASKPALERVS